MPRVAESTGTVEFRAAADADLEGEYAVFVAAQQELHSRRGAAWGPAPPFDPGRPVGSGPPAPAHSRRQTLVRRRGRRAGRGVHRSADPRGVLVLLRSVH